MTELTMNTQKTKNGAGTQRKATDRRQTNIGRKHRTRSIPGYCCLASQCYLTEGRPLPTRFGVGGDVPSQSLTEPAAFQRECWAPVLCWLPVAFQRSLGLSLTLARTTNSPLIRPNKSQLPSSANAGPRPYAGLNQT